MEVIELHCVRAISPVVQRSGVRVYIGMSLEMTCLRTRSRQLGTIRKSVKTGESHLVPYVICDVVGEMVFDGDPCPLDDEGD
jgi:hypothetical protein